MLENATLTHLITTYMTKRSHGETVTALTPSSYGLLCVGTPAGVGTKWGVRGPASPPPTVILGGPPLFQIGPMLLDKEGGVLL